MPPSCLLMVLAAAAACCGRAARGEHLADALRRRSDAFLVYASNFADEYEPGPAVYAAVPLSRPLPVVQLLTTSPLRPVPLLRAPAASGQRLHAADTLHVPAASGQRLHAADTYGTLYAPAASSQHLQAADTYGTLYAPAASSQRVYAADTYGTLYAPAASSQRVYAADTYGTQHAPPRYMVEVGAPARPDTSASSSETVLYARPDQYGGYTYVRAEPVSSHAKRKVKQKRKKPLILRIHKYRVVRDDR